MWNWFADRVKAGRDCTAVITPDEHLSYHTLARRAEEVAESLPSEDGPRPWRVAVRDPDPWTVLIRVLACWRRGYSPVVLRDSMTQAQVADIVRWLKPLAVLDGPLAAVSETTSGASRPLADREEALVICTSGTTGIPKLVALPAESVRINAMTIAGSLGIGTSDLVAVNTPLGYMYGLMGGCMASIHAMATIRLFRPRDPLTQLQAGIRREGVTVVQGPPSLFRLFLAYWNGEPFPGVKVVTTGGEPLGEELADGLARAFPNARRLFLYGMTEAGPRISHLDFNQGGGQDSCIGVPYDHIDWRLEPVDGTDAGRLILRGPGMFLGYITSDGCYEGLDDAGFFHSNDLLSRGPSGYLHFRGRVDRVFRSGGRLVNPEAVERVLASHPCVADAVCFAEPHPVLGLVPIAEIVMREGAILDQAALHGLCAGRMEAHAIPRRLIQVEAGSLADSGKRARPRPSTPHRVD
jgi:acyl-coenzyme A synthetase/AMP-(fatty) acid ligase